MNFQKHTTRRSFLYNSSVYILGASSFGMKEPSNALLHQYDHYGWLRGFNIVPSWGARIEDAWWFYDPQKMREEVSLSRLLHANTIRLWIEYSAWVRDPEKTTEFFLDAVKAIGEAGMKTMPCLFNRWHQASFDYGGTYIDNLYRGWEHHFPYIRSLVEPLAHDDRILLWDLCNEPQATSPYAKEMTNDSRKIEYEWLASIAHEMRSIGVQQPITVGTMRPDDIIMYEPICDVLCAHPYALTPEALIDTVTKLSALRKEVKKPLIVNECMPGSLDDLLRADIVRFTSEILSEARFGWMGWALKSGLAVSTREDRVSGPSPNNDGYYPFFTGDNRLRSGLEFLMEPPKNKAPWE